MTTESEAREAVYQRFVDNWGALTAYTFENEEFTAPSTTWVRLAFRNTNSQQDTMGETGNRKFLRSASIFLQIFFLTNTGTATVDTLVRAFRSIFEGTRFSGIVVNNAVSREIGPDGKFYQAVVEAFCEYEEVK